MFRSHARFCALAAGLLVVNAAGLVWIRHTLASRSPSRIRVLAALPARDVDTADRLTLLFDEPLVATDRIEQPLAESPFVIEPQPPGCWRWAATDRLEYRLDRPLPPGNVFRVVPASDFELQTRRRLIGDGEFEFRTRALQVASCDFTAVERDLGYINISFNQPVDPRALGKYLTINGIRPDDDSSHTGLPNTVMPIWLTREPSSRLALQAHRPPSDRLNVEIDAQATGAEGHLPLGRVFRKEFQFDPVFRLQDVYTSESSFGNSTVHLDFTHYLDRDQPQPTVTIDPPVEGVRASIQWDEVQLCGPFESGRRYTATVGADLLSRDEAALGESQSISFEMSDRPPGVRFAVARGILNPHGNLVVDLEAVNIPGVDLHVTRVTANNVVAHLRGEETNATSRTVADRTLPLNLRQNAPATVALDLRELLGTPLGVYRIDAEASDDGWVDDHVVVSVTDLAITAKTERDGLWAWITSLSTGKPVAEVTVRAVSYNNQILAEGVTGPDGTVQMKVPEGPDGPVWVVLAERGDDLAYLQPDRRTWVLDDVNQSGREIPGSYDAMLYTERGAYRPGDTIHVTGIVRDPQGNVPPAFPLSLVVRRPDGREVETLTVSTAENSQGVFQADFTADESARMGCYTFELTIPGSSTVLGETSALVEAFLPVRFEVNAEASASQYGPGETPEVTVEAQYLFGKPAAHLPIEVAGRHRAIAFQSKRFPAFTFGQPDEKDDKIADTVNDQLDESGKARIKLEPPAAEGNPGLWRSSWCATVTEPGSRSVSANLSAVIDTVNHHLGLRSESGRVVPVGMPTKIEWVQLTGADELATPHPASFSLHRVEYDWVIKEVDGRRVWQTHERLSPVADQHMPTSAELAEQGSFDAVLPTAGCYRVIATDETTKRRTSLDLYAASDQSEAGLLALNRPERLELILDRETYVPGGDASILVRSPFPGTLMLAVESDRVVSHQLVELDGNTATVELPIPKEIRGGAFVTATLVRPIDPQRDTWLPHRAMGMTRLLLDHAASSLNVRIAAAEQARPAESIHVSVAVDGDTTSNGPAVVHLWAVDDGILLPTNYQTPDPRKHFFAPRESFVETGDVFADLLPDTKRPASMEHIGAGEDEYDPEELRRNPVEVKRCKPAVLWQTIAPVDSNGMASWDIALPDAVGRLRFMAVAIDGDRYGSADHDVTVTAPLLVEASWPRFVAPGDRFDVPVKIFSDAEEPITVQLTASINGPIQIGDASNMETVRIEPGESMTVWLSATSAGIGPVSIGVTAEAELSNSEALHAKSEARFTVRPTAPLHVESKFVRVSPGAPVTIEPPTGFIAGTTRTTVQISSQPTVELLPAFEAVVHYPYGCVEQTTSTLYALLCAESYMKGALPDDIRTRSIPDMIKSGMGRLRTMQTHSGGLAYWPGGYEADVWGSAYAAGFLAEAVKAGYVPDAVFLRDLISYLERSLRAGWAAAEDENTRALICRALAESDAPPTGWMALLSDHCERLDRGGRANLAAAWIAAGRKDRASTILATDILEQPVANSSSGRITSPLRQDALLLSVLCSFDPDHPWIPRLVERVQAGRHGGRWGNTLENSTALVALATYQAGAPTDAAFTGELLVEEEGGLPFDHTKPASWTFEDLTEPLTVNVSGNCSAYASIATEGLLAEAAVDNYDRQLRVRRTWTDELGHEINPMKLHVGDLIHVAVTLEGVGLDADEPIPNIAIVDALPGGIEVENPRLATSADTDLKSTDVPDRVEFLDDRVVLFASAGERKQSFGYTLRATAAGSFALPAIQASSMYDGSYASLHEGGQVEILR